MSDIENLTIMFTDIVGFSNMVASLPRTESERVLKQHDKILQKVIKRFGGRTIKSVGDSFLVVYRSPTDAVLSAMAMQDSLCEYNNKEENEHKIIIRIALNTGEVRLTSNDVFGDAVNIAARLESRTPAGAILLTESVYLSMNKNEVTLKELGKHRFKGIPQPISIYQAKHKKTENPNPLFAKYPYGGAHKQLKPASRNIFTFGKLFVGLNAAIITAFVTWWSTINYMPGIQQIELDKVKVEYRTPTIDATPQIIVSSNDFTEDNIIGFEPDITGEITEKAKPLIKDKDYETLRELVSRYEADYPDNDYLKVLAAHADMFYKNYEASISGYGLALESDPTLADDDLLSRNLVRLLEHQRLKANRMLARYLSPPMISSLGRRTGQSGLRGRYDAFYLLIDSGNPEKVDKVGLNIWDLRELQECSLKKVAIKELKRLNDPKALPALKEVANMGIWKKLRYTCLRNDVKEAIKQLEGKGKDKKPKVAKSNKTEESKAKVPNKPKVSEEPKGQLQSTDEAKKERE